MLSFQNWHDLAKLRRVARAYNVRMDNLAIWLSLATDGLLEGLNISLEDNTARKLAKKTLNVFRQQLGWHVGQRLLVRGLSAAQHYNRSQND
jgi:hypothetical protein